MEILKSTVGILGLGPDKTLINEEERKSYRLEYRIQSPDYRFIYFPGQPSPASTGLVTGRSRLTPYCRPWDELAATLLRWRSTTSSTRLMTAQGWSLSRTSALSSMTRKVLKLTLNTKWQCLIVHEVTFYFWKGFKNIL